MPTVHHSYDTDDDTLEKLEAALKEAEGTDLRGSIRSAVEDRKAELRRQATDSA